MLTKQNKANCCIINLLAVNNPCALLNRLPMTDIHFEIANFFFIMKIPIEFLTALNIIYCIAQ